MHVLYHGTDAEASQQILREGFRTGTYFTAHFDSALMMGGDHVFAAVFDGEAPKYWEWISPEPVPTERILALRVVTVRLLHYQPAAQALLRKDGLASPCPRCDARGELAYPDDGHHLMPGGCAWGGHHVETCPDCEGFGDLQHPTLLANRQVRAGGAICD